MYESSEIDWENRTPLGKGGKYDNERGPETIELRKLRDTGLFSDPEKALKYMKILETNIEDRKGPIVTWASKDGILVKGLLGTNKERKRYEGGLISTSVDGRDTVLSIVPIEFAKEFKDIINDPNGLIKYKGHGINYEIKRSEEALTYILPKTEY